MHEPIAGLVRFTGVTTDSNNPETPRTGDLPDPGIPPGLAVRVRALHRPSGALPPEVDEAVHRAARATRHPLPAIRRARLGAAAAAVLALGAALWLWNPSAGPRGTPSASAQTAYDINGDGVVDMLDAHAIARGLNRLGLAQGHDVNNDGVVDEGDVDAVAMRAVRLRAES